MEGPSHLHRLGFYPEFEGMVGCFRDDKDTSSAHGGPPYAPVNPADERTYTFLGKYLKDLSDIFDSDFWHLGGDEVSIGCVKDLKSTSPFLSKNNLQLNELQNYYIKREKDILTAINPKIKAGYWWRGETNVYADGDVLQFWSGGGDLKKTMEDWPKQNFIYSPAGLYYLDCGYINQYSGGSWCGGIHNWRDIWNVDPRKLHTDSQKSRFWGGELPLWSEMNNEFNMPLKLFPRGAAMSYRLWNPNEPDNFAKVPEMLIKHQYRLKSYGVPCSRVTQRYCEKHLHHCFGKL